MSESQFKTRAVRYLKAHLPGAWIYHPSDKWISGIPDLLILWRGTFAAIELKVGRNKATELQKHTLLRIQSAGGYTAICYGDAGLDQIRASCQAIIEHAAAAAKTAKGGHQHGRE